MNTLSKSILFLSVMLSCSLTLCAHYTRNAGYWTSQDNTPSNNKSKHSIFGYQFWLNIGKYTHYKRIKHFFAELTPPSSQRENWYEKSPYIAEFWCTLSNVGFIGVGIYYYSPASLFAGACSMISHAIPLRCLNDLDKIGVMVLAASVLYYHLETIKNYPVICGLLSLSALGLNIADQHIARTYATNASHIVWHCGAAALLGYFLHLK